MRECPGQRDAAQQVGETVRIGQHEPGMTAGQLPQRNEVGGPESLGDPDAGVERHQRLLLAVHRYQQHTPVDQRQRPPRRVAVGVEQLHRAVDPVPRGRRPQVDPLHHGRRDERLAQRPVVDPLLFTAPHGVLRRLDRGGRAAGVEQGPCVRLEGAGMVAAGQQPVPMQDLLVQRGRLSMSSGRHCGPGRRRCVFQHGGVVARADRMVDHTCPVHVLRLEQRRQHPLVEPDPLKLARHRSLHRSPRQLVPEPECRRAHLHDARLLRLVECVRSRPSSARGATTPTCEGRPRAAAALRVSGPGLRTRARTASTTWTGPPVPGGDDLRHEEGLPRVSRCIDAEVVGTTGPGPPPRDGQPAQGDPLHARGRESPPSTRADGAPGRPRRSR